MIINGANLNMLGVRQPEIYGRESFEDYLEALRARYPEHNIDYYQSNIEGELVDAIQNAYFDGFDGIIFNPAGYTHTSVAILDAVKAVSIPTVEVHISDVSAREDFRQISYIRMACFKTISGKGTDGYLEAIDALIEKVGK